MYGKRFQEEVISCHQQCAGQGPEVFGGRDVRADNKSAIDEEEPVNAKDKGHTCYQGKEQISIVIVPEREAGFGSYELNQPAAGYDDEGRDQKFKAPVLMVQKEKDHGKKY
jgi:hypothetical protein